MKEIKRVGVKRGLHDFEKRCCPKKRKDHETVAGAFGLAKELSLCTDCTHNSEECETQAKRLGKLEEELCNA